MKTLFFSPVSHRGYQEIGGNRYTLKRVNKSPPVYVIDDFLSAADLDYFDEKIESCPFEKSFVDNMQHDQQTKTLGGSNNGPKQKRQRLTVLDTEHRTSTFYGFKKLHDTRIAALEQRIADLLGCFVHQIEALQLVRYKPEQFFGVHHDLGEYYNFR